MTRDRESGTGAGAGAGGAGRESCSDQRAVAVFDVSRPLPFPRFGFFLPSPMVLSIRTVKESGPPLDDQ